MKCSVQGNGGGLLSARDPEMLHLLRATKAMSLTQEERPVASVVAVPHPEGPEDL